VGVKTAQVGGLTTEIWYPAQAGTESGAQKTRYDIRDWLPASEKTKIPDADAPSQVCDCYRDLPLDASHGPYPVVFFVHGTAGFRTQSLELVTHWASRGFVVVAADHPGLDLPDLLTFACGGAMPAQHLDADVLALTSALGAPSGDVAFLAGHVDATRVGMAGHSAGGAEISKEGDLADVLIPMAGGGPKGGARLKSTLILGALEDKVVPYASAQSAFTAAPSPKRLVGLSPAGHLVFSSLCGITNAAGQDIVAIGKANNVCGLSLASGLFDCSASYVSTARGLLIVGDASSAAFEETLQCAPARGAWLSGIRDRYPEVAEAQEAL
jgi:alpha-beta hydrolase superfamily lysophospholipase